MPGTSKSYSILGRDFYRTPTGDHQYMGRTKKTTNNNSNSSKMNLFNNADSSGSTSPSQLPNLIGNGGGIDYNAGPKDLQSSAKTGNISGGTRAERKEARGLREKGSGPNPMAMIGAGLAVGGAALDALDTDPGYGGMDVGKEAVKFAAMGAAAGPIGAGIGFALGGAIGLVKKSRYEKEEKEADELARKGRANDQDSANTTNEAGDFFAGQSAASQGAYGVSDIDNFRNKYS
tara:strand:- start:47 stop:745 length:699 start_codon:yes stop_codon:yes gene_type:complete